MGAFTNLGLNEPTPGDPAVRNAWGTILNENDVIVDMATNGITNADVAGNSNVVLTFTAGTTQQDPAGHFDLTGELTGDIYVLWPNGRTRKFSAANNTTGAFTLSLGVNNGSGAPAGGTIALAQGSAGEFVSDGTNVIQVSGGAPAGPAGGDLGGSYPDPTVLSVADVTTGTLGVSNGGTGITGGTSGGVLAFSGAGTIISSGALTENLPVIGGGAGAAPTVGSSSGTTTKFATVSGATSAGSPAFFTGGGDLEAGTASGNTTVFATVSGSPTSGSTAVFDADGNVIAGSTSLPSYTNSLTQNVPLNNTGQYFTGPQVAQGDLGTWFVSGTITFTDSSEGASVAAKLWDGTTVIASGYATVHLATEFNTISLSGVITSPAGNLRISAKGATSTSSSMLYNQSGNGKDSTITAVRIG
jgi:hypothetical protein